MQAQTEGETAGRLLNGWTLKTLMEPDPGIETNGEAHLETLTLKAVIVRGNHFWGSTLMQHLNVMGDFLVPGFVSLLCFQYNSLDNKKYFSLISENLADHSCFQRIGHLTRYRSHKWTLIDDYEVILDSEKTPEKEMVRRSVRNGEDLKISILDEAGCWFICGVNRVCLVGSGERICMEADPFTFQPEFISEDWIDKVLRRDKDLENIHPVEGALIEGEVVHEQFVLDLDGYYTDARSRAEGYRKEPKRFKVFRKRLPANVRKIKL